MSCGVSAIEDDGLSAIKVGGLSSSLSCISCGCGVSTIEVGGLSSSSTCRGCGVSVGLLVGWFLIRYLNILVV